jgi:hypothetical protein
MLTTRTATLADLPTILDLTRANRSRLAEFEPDFWRKSANSNEIHRAFVTFQLGNDAVLKRVLERDTRVIGYTVSLRHPSGFYLIDDVCLAADADWLTDGARLLQAVAERPAVMTVPHADNARVDAARAIGLVHVSSVRSLRFDQKPRLELGPPPVPISVPRKLATPPLHVFLPAMAHESITVIGDGQGGYAVLSPAITAPPIYDPGGKPSVVDRVIVNDREMLLMLALSFAAQRGDVGVILIVAAGDAELSAIADRLGARRPVDIFKWPD